MQWRIVQTELFEKKFNKLIPKDLQAPIKRQLQEKLAHHPFSGKSLGYKFFREKRIKKWRIYYLIYESHLVLCLVDVSDKKQQHSTIERIKEQASTLKTEIEKKYPLT